ncbi:hypothetical protein KIS4809_5552 [Bacillus sp. ZZV12-4809]|nr:hypothetical protein KIS4809_5552 [Bacillus sp. ZZV12-4809]
MLFILVILDKSFLFYRPFHQVLPQDLLNQQIISLLYKSSLMTIFRIPKTFDLIVEISSFRTKSTMCDRLKEMTQFLHDKVGHFFPI